jgi:hypothetical protein
MAFTLRKKKVSIPTEQMEAIETQSVTLAQPKTVWIWILGFTIFFFVKQPVKRLRRI